MTPIIVPTTAVATAAVNPREKVGVVAFRSILSVSRPSESVPSKCLVEGEVG
jgi:hypothetical protein